MRVGSQPVLLSDLVTPGKLEVNEKRIKRQKSLVLIKNGRYERNWLKSLHAMPNFNGKGEVGGRGGGSTQDGQMDSV